MYLSLINHNSLQRKYLGPSTSVFDEVWYFLKPIHCLTSLVEGRSKNRCDGGPYVAFKIFGNFSLWGQYLTLRISLSQYLRFRWGLVFLKDNSLFNKPCWRQGVKTMHRWPLPHPWKNSKISNHRTASHFANISAPVPPFSVRFVIS